MMAAVRISETSVENHFTRQYIPEDNSEYPDWDISWFLLVTPDKYRNNILN
jgi:hypothetical protein